MPPLLRAAYHQNNANNTFLKKIQNIFFFQFICFCPCVVNSDAMNQRIFLVFNAHFKLISVRIFEKTTTKTKKKECAAEKFATAKKDEKRVRIKTAENIYNILCANIKKGEYCFVMKEANLFFFFWWIAIIHFVCFLIAITAKL